MQCPKCDGKTKVFEVIKSGVKYTRRRNFVSDENAVQRKRRCTECGHRFVTVEIQADGIDNVKEMAERLVAQVEHSAGTMKTALDMAAEAIKRIKMQRQGGDDA